MGALRAVVVGQLARDVVLMVGRMPPAGAAADATLRRELLGGKGANQAVALSQLGVAAGLVAVAGDDEVADRLLAQARRDGIDVRGVVRRSGTPSGLIVEILDEDGDWRYVQHLPDAVRLSEADVRAAAGTLAEADAVLVQLRQPPRAALAAAALARDAGRLVVLDGCPAGGAERGPLLAAADVVRADARETASLLGLDGAEADRVRSAAGGLLDGGPGLCALGVAEGNLFVWRDRRWGEGELLLPLSDEKVVDTTGAGDAFTAALTLALLRGDQVPAAARYAVAAAGATVGHAGGRPELSAEAIDRRLAYLERR